MTDMHPPAKRGLYIAFFAILMGYSLLISAAAGAASQSADLYASWVAAEFMQMGQQGQIYPNVADGFTMQTPAAWWPHVSAIYPDARVYPYLYPPLWAGLLAPVTDLITFEALDALVLGLHQLLLIATIILVSRMCRTTGIAQWAFVALTYSALTMSSPVSAALAENQPQLLVSFLVVFAFERVQFGHARLSGVLLALAAAIKLYPLLFVAIYLGRRQWPAVISFAITGAGLGVASIVIGGWALHLEYLNLVSALTGSVIVTNMSMSLDALVSGTLFTDQLVRITPDNMAGTDRGWGMIQKSDFWRFASGVANLGAVAAIALLAALRPRDPLVVPVAAIVFGVMSPLSWSYTYLTAFVFLGALPLRFGVSGYVMITLTGLFFHRATPVGLLGMFNANLTIAWAVSIALIVFFGGAFVWATLRRAATNAPTPAPAPFLPT